MESKNYEKYISAEIRIEVVRQKTHGKKTSKGEPMSLAAIGRTLDPPVSRVAMYHTVKGTSESRRIKDAVEKELGKVYWIRNAA